MKKRDKVAVRALPRRFVDEPDAGSFESGELRAKVGHAIGSVVQFRFRVAAVSRDRSFFVERPQEFDNRAAGLQSDGFNALIGKRLAVDLFKSEGFCVQGYGFT